ncbi:MAG: hypothetical protein WC533_00775 [Candidatus Pacearchaeota archaeon]
MGLEGLSEGEDYEVDINGDGKPILLRYIPTELAGKVMFADRVKYLIEKRDGADNLGVDTFTLPKNAGLLNDKRVSQVSGGSVQRFRMATYHPNYWDVVRWLDD